MPHCELCGKETEELTKTKVSGAELQLCDNCTDHGTTLEKNTDNQDTKYSTGSSNSSSSEESETNDNKYNNQKNTGSSTKTQDKDPFEDVSDLALNYGQKIQRARQRNDMDRNELAQNLGIKESYLQNIENEQTQPSLDLQKKIEKSLDIDLSQTEELGHD